MQHWSWWLSGIALAGVPILNWLLVRRMMAVSGRFTALVDRLRQGPAEPVDEMSPEELLAAVQAVTAAEFGDDAIESGEMATVADEPAAPSLPPRTPAMHLVFLVSLLLGGLLSALLAGGVTPTAQLSGSSFQSVFGTSPWATPAVLVFGGALVGFGTRMAAGCTSGHGLCGVSRAQLGSVVATAAFFGMGIAVSFALELF